MQKLKQKYSIAKAKDIGQEATCPCCDRLFIKKTKQQAFCGGRGNTKCKDKYWNTVTPNKRNNTTRISSASADWSARQVLHRGKPYSWDDDYYEDEHPFSSEALGQWDD